MSVMKYRLTPILIALGACSDAIDWLARERHPTFADAWRACDNHDWLIWVVGHTMPLCEIVSLARDLGEPGLAHTSDLRPRECLDTVRRWLRGEATIKEVLCVREAALAARDAADVRAAAYAAYAAEHVADATYADGAGDYAARAAYAVACASAATHATEYAAAAAMLASFARSREIIRRRFPASRIEARLVEIGRERGCLEVVR